MCHVSLIQNLFAHMLPNLFLRSQLHVRLVAWEESTHAHIVCYMTEVSSSLSLTTQVLFVLYSNTPAKPSSVNQFPFH